MEIPREQVGRWPQDSGKSAVKIWRVVNWETHAPGGREHLSADNIGLQLTSSDGPFSWSGHCRTHIVAGLVDLSARNCPGEELQHRSQGACESKHTNPRGVVKLLHRS
jgi:hypothetical protein